LKASPIACTDQVNGRPAGLSTTPGRPAWPSAGGVRRRRAYPVDPAPSRTGSIAAMLKKLLIVAVLVALGAVAAKRLRAS